MSSRWSPRAYLDEPVDPADLALVFEAARLSPSCYNEQPWHFYTSTPASYQTFLGLLVEGNQAWAQAARGGVDGGKLSAYTVSPGRCVRLMQ